MQPLIDLYDNTILKHPTRSFILVALAVLLCMSFIPRFELDASAESLTLENDQDMTNFRMVSERYGASEFLFVTYTPPETLFSKDSLERLAKLRDALKTVAMAESVLSILDVPLLENPPGPVTELVDNIKTLESPDVDLELAKQELSISPLFDNMIVNVEENTTAIQITLPYDHEHRALTKEREQLWVQQAESLLMPEDKKRLHELNTMISVHNSKSSENLHQGIMEIRELLKPFQAEAEIHLGGTPMIADDMISYVRSDMVSFGVGVFLFLIIMLAIIFRKPRWVIIALSICSIVILCMMGLLGLFDWKVTVISSNFASLILILTMSICIHLTVRYREFHVAQPDWTQMQLVRETVRKIFKPCLYTVLTTMVAFASLVFSGIRPVIDFGWMMATGVLFALFMAFILFPLLLLMTARGTESHSAREESPITGFFAYVTTEHGNKVLFISMLIALLSGIGISRLEVENSFVDYFKDSTEIRQGMLVIDQRLGGTTPLEVLLNFPEIDLSLDNDEAGFLDDDFGLDEQVEEGEDSGKYWFTREKVDQIKAVHQYFEQQPAVGKVTSLATMVEVAERINGEPLDSVALGLLYSAIPEEFKALVISPYVSIEDNQARISMRLIDSDPNLRRNQFLQQVNNDMQQRLNLEQEDYLIAGMMVLYNNMLQSLFDSQIKTLGAVFIGIMLMFVVLFRSIKLAVLAIIPNVLSAALVLGIMGWLGLPLDMMTITIAAITIGIAVDDTIHYIHRFTEEFEKDRDYRAAILRCHNSIGKAVYYTSITIIVGFSILGLSNFIPTIYFGLLTGMAMFAALVFVLTLLPKLLMRFKALG
jgi:predicted RND superfamily exporter protein